ncbi:MAG: hypothetical protein DRI84_06770 [Bacteroidetes bacterium]|nr:MAG: hypothetical protein DRI84_06770 [Bacteroidota bacterium]
MKNTNFLLILLIVPFCITKAQLWSPDTDPNYHLVWEDNFDTLNTSKWEIAHNFDHYGEPQVFLDSNVSIEDGKLNLTLEYEKYHADTNLLDSFRCFHQLKYGTDYDYTAGWVQSKRDYNVGINTYIEARIKFPYGKSYWPAFWMFRGEGESESLTDYNELDIIEVVGYLGRDITTANTHHPTTGPHYIHFDSIGINYNYDDSFIVYGVKWLHDSLFFYVDGHLALAFENVGQMTPKRIVFNVSMMMDTNGVVLFPGDSARCPDTMQVDYIRVFDYTADSTYAATDKIKEPYIINPIGTKIPSAKQVQIRWQLNDSIYNLSNGFCHVEQWSDTSYGWPGYSTGIIPQLSSDHLFNCYVGGSTEQKTYYRVVVDGIDEADQPFPEINTIIFPPHDNATSTKFYAYGDTRGNYEGVAPPFHDSVCKQILKEIKADPASQTFLLHAGDWNLQDSEKSWQGEFFNRDDRNVRELMANVAIMGAKGNHEIYKDANGKEYDGQNYKKYFPFPYNCNNYTGNNFTYSFINGPVLFIVLNIDKSGYESSFQQYGWLQAKLANTDKKWKVVMFHAPFKTVNRGLAHTNTINDFVPLLKQYGVQLVIAGHEHYYAHWVDQGTHFLTLGGGGMSSQNMLHNLLQSQDEVYAATIPHFAKFNVHDDIMSVDIIQGVDHNLAINPDDTSGSFLERFSIASKYEIDDQVTWDNDSLHPVYANNIKINDGGLLRVQSSVNVIGSGYIEVETGGHLIVEGDTALLTNYQRAPELLYLDKDSIIYTDFYYTEDTTLWRGIIVKGDAGSSQIPESNQGLLEVKNGATIANAQVAVYVGAFFVNNGNGAMQNNNGGGIIKIDGAHFWNNQKDIMMKPYELWSTTTQKPILQKSYIVASEFRNDINMLESDAIFKAKQGNIFIHSINGLRIQGNTFENMNYSLEVQDKGVGISAENSSLNVSPYCDPQITPCSILAKNQFKNLYYGVRVINGISPNALVKINDNIFDNTYRAIMLSGTHNANVLENSIKAADQVLVQSGQPDPPQPYGIYINGGKGFKVEENTIYRPSSDYAMHNGSRGIIVHKTGTQNNEIYKNTLTNLFMGNQAQCFNSGDGTNASMGLKYFCNTNQDDSYDIWAGGLGYCTGPVDFVGSVPRIGIAKFQRQSNPDYPALSTVKFLPAGNQFSDSHSSLPATAVNDFDNEEAQWLEYSWGNLNPNSRFFPSYRTENVDTNHISIDTVSLNACPSKISSGGNGVPIGALYTELSSAQIAYNSSKTLLDIWENGGNANLDEEVETTAPWEAYQQFNSLLAESPYLSEEVIVEFINNPVFTSLMVKLLVIANPHAVHSEEVMFALENRNPAMPQSYILEIRSQPEVSSQLQALEGDVAADYHLISIISENIKRNYRSDTTNSWAGDSLIAFMSRSVDLYDRYELATIYLAYGLYEEMQSCIDNIASSFELNIEMTEDFTNFETMMGIAEDLQQDELYEDGLDESQRLFLGEVLEADRPYMAPIALSLLQRDDPLFVYQEWVYDIPENGSRMATHSIADVNELEKDKEFKLYPNPAREYTTLSYNCKYINLTYSISDIQGRVLRTEVLETIEDANSKEVLIDLAILSSGSYQITIRSNDLVLWTEKLIITE